jgi:DNA-binding CsgD family transcriptional regulator
MRLPDRLRTTSVRRAIRIAAILTGLYLWAMAIVGLSFATIDRGVPQWWLVPLFGVLMAAIAAYTVSRVPAVAPSPGAPSPVSPSPVSPPPVSPPPVSPPPVSPPEAAPTAVTMAAPIAAPTAVIEPLSPREVEVLRQLAAGRSNREIAKALFVAPGTVKAHLNHIFRKLGARGRLQAIAHAREAGLLDG